MPLAKLSSAWPHAPGGRQFEAWISQEHRKDLALLLGAQDGQEGRGRLSIHYQKSTLQFADTGYGPVV
jgi:hypothetical protein